MGKIVSSKTKAQEILEQYNIRSAPIDVEDICERENIDIRRIDMTELEDVTGMPISGLIQKTPEHCTIFVNENDISVRQRFTIAHELGHYFLHMDDDESAVITSFRMDRSPQETQANAFAAELLMPEELLRKEYDKMIIPVSDSLARTFRVSKESMRIRLDNLELVYV